MYKEITTTFVILCVITIGVAIYTQKKIVDNHIKIEASVNELEFLVADLWAEKEECIEELGVFRKPKGKKKIKKGKG